MKKIISLFVLVLCSTILPAQDQLFKKDNTKQEVKILEINTTEVKYKLFSNLDGPTYIIEKKDIALIIYKNGEHEAFKDAPQPQAQTHITSPYVNSMDSFLIKRDKAKLKRFEELTRRKNIVSINTFGFLNSCVSLSYYREMLNGVLGIHVPLAFSFNTPQMESSSFLGLNPNYYYSSYITNYKIKHKAIDIGLGLYVQTSGKRAATHFVGPLFRIVQYNGTFDSYDFTTNPNGYLTPSGTSTHAFVLNQTYCMLNNGVLFRINPQFTMMIHAAVGFISDRHYVANDPSTFNNNNGYYPNYAYTNSPSFQLGYSIGYRF